jgi:hypothetical protein
MANRFNSSTSNNNEINNIESRENITDDESRICETIKDRNLQSSKMQTLMMNLSQDFSIGRMSEAIDRLNTIHKLPAVNRAVWTKPAKKYCTVDL